MTLWYAAHYLSLSRALLKLLLFWASPRLVVFLELNERTSRYLPLQDSLRSSLTSCFHVSTSLLIIPLKMTAADFTRSFWCEQCRYVKVLICSSMLRMQEFQIFFVKMSCHLMTTWDMKSFDHPYINFILNYMEVYFNMFLYAHRIQG